MEEAYEMGNYLPLSLKDPSQDSYIRFLWKTFATNYQAGSRQFAFLAYHLLMMSFVYFKIWQIRQTWPDDFEKGVIGYSRDNRKCLGNESPFEFSNVGESNIFRLFKLINCDYSDIGNYTKLVRDRNDIAHAKGHIYYRDQAALDRKLDDVLRAVDEIQSNSRTLTECCYRTFLLESFDEEGREYQDPSDQIMEVLVRGNYMSERDIDVCLSLDITRLSQCVEVDMDAVEILHNELHKMFSGAD